MFPSSSCLRFQPNSAEFCIQLISERNAQQQDTHTQGKKKKKEGNNTGRSKDNSLQVLTQSSALDCPCISESSLVDVAFPQSSSATHSRYVM